MTQGKISQPIHWPLKRPENTEYLVENAEYHMAKDEQKLLLARQAELQGEIMRAKPTDFSDAPEDSIGIGSAENLIDQSKRRVSATRHFRSLGQAILTTMF